MGDTPSVMVKYVYGMLDQAKGNCISSWSVSRSLPEVERQKGAVTGSTLCLCGMSEELNWSFSTQV